MRDAISCKPPAPAIVKAATVMDLVAASPDALTLTELSRRMKIAKSSVHSVCSTLVELGLLLRNPDQTFAIGSHMMRWATSFTRRSDLSTEFARIWDESTIELKGAAVTLTVLDGNEIVYIGTRTTSYTPWFTYRIGKRLPMAFTANGHAFLLQASDAEIRRRFQNKMPEPITPKSPRTVDELLSLIAEARELGYSQDREYVLEGKHCFGSPVFGVANKIVAAIAISVRIEEVTPQFKQQIIETLTQLSRTISERLGAEIEGLPKSAVEIDTRTSAQTFP